MFIRSPNKAQRNSKVLYIIFLATLIAGSLDIGIALGQYYLKTNLNPEPVLKFIASAVFGKRAYSGGAMVSFLGLIFHFLVTFVWATIFVLAYPKLIGIIENHFLLAILTGLVIWLVMNLVVLPFTNLPKLPVSLTSALTGVVILIVAIGLPFAFIMKKYHRRLLQQQSRNL